MSTLWRKILPRPKEGLLVVWLRQVGETTRLRVAVESRRITSSFGSTIRRSCFEPPFFASDNQIPRLSVRVCQDHCQNISVRTIFPPGSQWLRSSSNSALSGAIGHSRRLSKGSNNSRRLRESMHGCAYRKTSNHSMIAQTRGF